MAKKVTKPRPKQGQLLAQLRMEAGLSQYELAQLIREPQSNVAFWEQSEKPPRSAVLPKLAKALGVCIEDLLNGDPGIERKGDPRVKCVRSLRRSQSYPDVSRRR